MADKKPTTKKATTAKAPTSKAPKASATPKSASATSKSSSVSKPSAAPVSSSKPAASAKPDAVPLTPKTPKAPQTPKGPSTSSTKPSKPASSRPATATTAKPAPAAKKPATDDVTATKKPAADTRPATARGAPSDAAPAKKLVKSASAKAASVTQKPTAAPGKATSAAKPATENKTPREKPKDAAPAARPATTGSAKAAPAKPAASTAAKPRPATATATAASIKKVPSIDKVPATLPKKSPRSPRHPDSAKSPHNVGITRAHTASEISGVPQEARLAAGARSVSVGGMPNITRAAAPAGRRKATTSNPLRGRQSTPLTERPKEQRAASGMLSGLGLLAAVGARDGHEMNGVQLRKVSDEKPKVLLIHVKGRRHVTARVAETHHRALNKGDAFVVVDPSTRRIFEWRGASANKMEIAKAMDLAGRIKNKEFAGRAEMFVLEDGKNDHHQGFWELIGGKGTIAPAEHAGEDEEEDKQSRMDLLLGVQESAQGKLSIVEIAKHKLSKDMLQSGQVYILDCNSELYMWVGKGCSNAHRTLISTKAQEVLTSSKKRPKWVVITRVIEGAEPEIFKEKFGDWPSTLPITMAAVPKGNVAGSRAMLRYDVSKMLVHAKREDRVIDDGSGKVEIWRVKDHSKEPIDKHMYGQFFDSESYVILYTYMQRNRELYIIYFWQGKRSSITEKGSSALLTIDLDDSIGGNAVQIRVVQNKEPKHFMKLFKGRIVVHHKADESEEGASIVPETALYHVRGFNGVEGGCDVRAIPAPSPSTKYLNTNDIFILNTTEKQYIWHGNASNKFFTVSNEILEELGASFKASREQVMIREGEEPKDFWAGLGEKNFPDLDSVRVKYYTTEWTAFPRMFHCSSASGAFMVEEVLEWDQEELDPGHLNILDTSGDIFLWTGHRANLPEEKRLAMEAVLDYAAKLPGRKENQGEVLCVNGRREPHSFRAIFHGWDESKSPDATGTDDSVKVSDMLKDLSRTYTLAELRNPPTMLDSTKLETYLSDAEFEETFKMDRPTFLAQPLWKQEGQKKNVGLY